jgi:hypothetical protein
MPWFPPRRRAAFTSLVDSDIRHRTGKVRATRAGEHRDIQPTLRPGHSWRAWTRGAPKPGPSLGRCKELATSEARPWRWGVTVAAREMGPGIGRVADRAPAAGFRSALSKNSIVPSLRRRFARSPVHGRRFGVTQPRASESLPGAAQQP